MAKQPAASAPAKSASKTISRTRRNSLMRKCLPKDYKRMLMTATKGERKAMLEAWKESRKKVKEVSA